jgi:hypothetical protein
MNLISEPKIYTETHPQAFLKDGSWTIVFILILPRWINGGKFLNYHGEREKTTGTILILVNQGAFRELCSERELGFQQPSCGLLSRKYTQSDSCPNIAVNFYVNEFGKADNLVSILGQVIASKGKGFNSLIHCAGTYGLNVYKFSLAKYSCNSPRYS